MSRRRRGLASLGLLALGLAPAAATPAAGEAPPPPGVSRRQADALVSRAGTIREQIVSAVHGTFPSPEVEVELLGDGDVKVLCKVRVDNMAYPGVQAALRTLASTINREVLGKHHQDLTLSPNSALVVVNKRHGPLPGAAPAHDASPAPRTLPAPRGLGAGAFADQLARHIGRGPPARSTEEALAAEALREVAEEGPPPAPPRRGPPGPGDVLPGPAGLVLASQPARRPPTKGSVLPGPAGVVVQDGRPGRDVPEPLPGILAAGEGVAFVFGPELAALDRAPARPAPRPDRHPDRLTPLETEARAAGFAVDLPLPLPEEAPHLLPAEAPMTFAELEAAMRRLGPAPARPPAPAPAPRPPPPVRRPAPPPITTVSMRRTRLRPAPPLRATRLPPRPPPPPQDEFSEADFEDPSLDGELPEGLEFTEADFEDLDPRNAYGEAVLPVRPPLTLQERLTTLQFEEIRTWLEGAGWRDPAIEGSLAPSGFPRWEIEVSGEGIPPARARGILGELARTIRNILGSELDPGSVVRLRVAGGRRDALLEEPLLARPTYGAHKLAPRGAGGRPDAG